jgi:hypoxanthine phosphoribosyltransferase
MIMEKVESFKCKLVTWDEIATWTETVARKISETGFKPTVVIGLTRGGWVPARLICDHLKVKKLYAVKTEHWGVTANQDGKALLTQELSMDIANDNVLVVDDITDTGESLILALGHLMKMKPKELKSSTLLHIAHSKIQPDFFCVHVPKEEWTWFIFPWNLHEDLRTILPKTLTEARNEKGIQKAFMDQFFITVPIDLIRETLEELKSEGIVQKKGDVWVRSP